MSAGVARPRAASKPPQNRLGNILPQDVLLLERVAHHARPMPRCVTEMSRRRRQEEAAGRLHATA